MFKKPLWQTVWVHTVASKLNSSVMLGNYLQQKTFSDAFFSWHFKGKIPFSIPKLYSTGVQAEILVNIHELASEICTPTQGSNLALANLLNASSFSKKAS